MRRLLGRIGTSLRWQRDLYCFVVRRLRMFHQCLFHNLLERLELRQRLFLQQQQQLRAEGSRGHRLYGR